MSEGCRRQANATEDCCERDEAGAHGSVSLMEDAARAVEGIVHPPERVQSDKSVRNSVIECQLRTACGQAGRLVTFRPGTETDAMAARLLAVSRQLVLGWEQTFARAVSIGSPALAVAMGCFVSPARR